jgi:hypothetical protein
MRKSLIFLACVTPVGLTSYIVGWWRGWRVAMDEQKQQPVIGFIDSAGNVHHPEDVTILREVRN